MSTQYRIQRACFIVGPLMETHETGQTTNGTSFSILGKAHIKS